MGTERQGLTSTSSESGFTLIEVLVSILITLIVMASVFALLTRGQRSFEREPEVADLQQSARAVLDMVSKDILQAGGGLPPEYPSFSQVRGGDSLGGGAIATDSIEIVGTFQAAGDIYLEPEDVRGLQGAGSNIVEMNDLTTNFELNDMVVLYNDGTDVTAGLGIPPQFAMARVDSIVENTVCTILATCALIGLDFGAYDPAYSNYVGGPGAPPDPATFLVGPDNLARLARVSVVQYFTVPDDPTVYSGPPPDILMRNVDFAAQSQAVGYLENFQITYVVGVTVPANQDVPPNPMVDLGAATPLNADNMLSGVRVTVTARSVTAGMEGASEGGAGRTDDFIRKTFSTNVNPRNLSAGLDVRMMSAIVP